MVMLLWLGDAVCAREGAYRVSFCGDGSSRTDKKNEFCFIKLCGQKEKYAQRKLGYKGRKVINENSGTKRYCRMKIRFKNYAI
jgi:hypothetical protein